MEIKRRRTTLEEDDANLEFLKREIENKQIKTKNDLEAIIL